MLSFRRAYKRTDPPGRIKLSPPRGRPGDETPASFETECDRPAPGMASRADHANNQPQTIGHASARKE